MTDKLYTLEQAKVLINEQSRSVVVAASLPGEMVDWLDANSGGYGRSKLIRTIVALGREQYVKNAAASATPRKKGKGK